MSYSRGMGVDVAPVDTKAGSQQNTLTVSPGANTGAGPAPRLIPVALPPCPPVSGAAGYRLGNGQCEYLYGPVQLPSQGRTPLPVSRWRVDIQRTLEQASRAVMGLGEQILGPIATVIGSMGTDIMQELRALFAGILDPTVPDVRIAQDTNNARERYRQNRQNLPAPVVSVLDPFVDIAWSLVPSELRPAGNQNVSVACAATEVPWIWIAGGFLGGLATAAIFGRSKPTPNRRTRRNRRRR